MVEWVDMPTTMWTVILHAQQKGPEALDLLFRKYRPPVLAYVKNAGFRLTDAEDLANDVFLTILEHDIIARADRAKGRFRSFLLAITRNVISQVSKHDGRIKRGGDATTHSLDMHLDAVTGLTLEDVLASSVKDDTFDVEWVQHLVLLGMQALKKECETEDLPFFRALYLQVEHEQTYDQIAQELGVKESDVRNYLHQARVRLKKYVLAEVRTYSSSRAEYEEEISYLMNFLE